MLADLPGLQGSTGTVSLLQDGKLWRLSRLVVIVWVWDGGGGIVVYLDNVHQCIKMMDMKYN